MGENTLTRVGHYRVMRLLGAGGMGEVYMGHDERLDRPVAIKRLIAPDAGESERTRARFRREANLAAKLNHPAIVQVYDVVREGDNDCIVMEYVEGSDLRKYLATQRPGIARIVRIALQVAEGMAEAHDRDIVHRDLKSENVLLTANLDAKITDFGIAKLVGSDSLTADGTVLGTYRAMSPEQAAGRNVDHRSDLFSFGVLLYEALVGETPFHADNPLAMVMRITHDEPTPVDERRPETPVELARLTEHLLRKAPRLRPRGFREVATALAELVEEIAPETRAISSSEAAYALDDTIPPQDAAAGAAAAAETPTAPTVPTAPFAALDVASGDAPLATAPTVATDLPPPPTTAGTTAPPRHGRMAPQAGVLEDRDDDAADDGESEERPRGKKSRLAAVTTGVVLAGLITAAGFLAWPRGPAPIRVAVLGAEVLTEFGAGEKQGAVNRAKRTLDGAVKRGLIQIEGLIVLPTNVSGEEYASVEARRELASQFSADEIVTSKLVCFAEDACSVSSSWYRADGSLRHGIDDFEVSLSLFNRSALTIASRMHEGYPERKSSVALNVNEEDYERYLQLRSARRHGDPPMSYRDMLTEARAIRGRSPGFLEVYLFEADLLRAHFVESRDMSDLDRALELSREAMELAPDTWEPLGRLIEVLLARGDVESVTKRLEELERLGPGNPWILMYRADMAYLAGSLQQAIAFARQAAKRFPSVPVLYNLAGFEFYGGDMASAREHFNSVLQIWPDHYNTLSELALIELTTGSPARALESLERLDARQRSGSVSTRLGLARLLLGRRVEAIADLERAVEVQPGSVEARFHLAYARQLDEDPEQANGQFKTIADQIDRDPVPLSSTYRIMRAVAWARLKRASSARSEADAAVKSAPGNNHVAYHAAVTYALLGEDELATEQAVRALRLGYGEHWFQFPWFDSVRGQPRFIEALDRLQARTSR